MRRVTRRMRQSELSKGAAGFLALACSGRCRCEGLRMFGSHEAFGLITLIIYNPVARHGRRFGAGAAGHNIRSTV